MLNSTSLIRWHESSFQKTGQANAKNASSADVYFIYYQVTAPKNVNFLYWLLKDWHTLHINLNEKEIYLMVSFVWHIVEKWIFAWLRCFLSHWWHTLNVSYWSLIYPTKRGISFYTCSHFGHLWAALSTFYPHCNHPQLFYFPLPLYLWPGVFGSTGRREGSPHSVGGQNCIKSLSASAHLSLGAHKHAPLTHITNT